MTQTFTKPALSLTDQLALLESRGLIVDDHAAALHALAHISYYRLRAYWLYFEVDPANGDHMLRAGTRFGDVLALYDFDRQLRLLVLDALERVEVAIRGAWAHRMAMAHGPHGYLDPALYRDPLKFAVNVAQLQSEHDRSHEVFVSHYRATYGDPPLPPVWMAAEFMSFGLLSKFISSLGPRADRRVIARGFGLEDWALTSFAHHVAAIRNICAHHGRLWNRRLTVTMQLPKRPTILAASLEQGAPRRLYNTLTTLRFILASIAPASTWATKLDALLTAHPTGDLTAMGFPADWRSRPLW